MDGSGNGDVEVSDQIRWSMFKRFAMAVAPRSMFSSSIGKYASSGNEYVLSDVQLGGDNEFRSASEEELIGESGKDGSRAESQSIWRSPGNATKEGSNMAKESPAGDWRLSAETGQLDSHAR